jgi:hypothetical protein
MAALFMLQGALNPATAHMTTTSETLRENSADAPEPIRRRLPAMSHHAEILDVNDPDLGYDAENTPDTQTEREKRVTCSAWR